MYAVLAAAFLALGARLVAVQGLDSGHYQRIAADQVTGTVQLTAMRGGLYDRNGAVLAISVPRSTVVADPFLISDPAKEAALLAPVLGLGVPDLDTKLSQHSGFVYLAHKVDDATAKAVQKLNLAGITLLPDSQRVDPVGQLGSSVLGMVGAQGSGLAGLEYQYEHTLAGRSGTATVMQNADGVQLPGGIVSTSASRPGTGLELTLDESLQYVTEQALGAEVVASHARSGIAVVMNTQTGDILSMANLVDDPAKNQIEESPQNLALTQVYEPGSVFKLVSFSAALGQGLISPGQTFTVPNSVIIDGWTFHDAESHPTEQLTATQILAQSSNVGTIEIAQTLGKAGLASQIGALGFGHTTGLGFPGESPGIVKSNPAKWSASDIGSTPIGQNDSVTAQQVLDMVNTVANGGVFVPPRLVRATVAPDGSVTPAPLQATHRVLQPTTVTELVTMMEQVVQDGTAVAAGVPGYTVAGKTGTAQIPDPKHLGYIPGAYMATFAGFAPAEHPVLAAIVVLDRPSPIFGGLVAAPVFSQVMRYALHRYGVPTSPGGGTTGGSAQAIPYPAAPSTPAGQGNQGAQGTPGTIAAPAGTATAEGP
ncbi:MAG TPA: penicillin-binding protein 2 [Acidimicrobiales bacterium]|nr:penicillin-binding protein 2 [Acidimicrobiales bacterium]